MGVFSARSALLATTSGAILLGSPVMVKSQEAFVLDDIFVSAANRDERSLSDVPATVQVQTAETAAREQATTFEEFVNDIPGVEIAGGPRSVAQEPNIRGFSDNQILLRVDGGRQNFNLGHQGRFFLDPAFIKQVEVVKGGGSTLFGSGALGGVIAVETLDAEDLIADGASSGGRLSFGYSSNGDVYNTSAGAATDFGTFDILGLIGVRQGDDLETGGGDAIVASETDALNTIFKFGFEPTNDQRFELSFSRYDDETTVPAAADGVFSATRNPLVDRDGTTIDVRASYEYDPVDNPLINLSALIYYTDIDIVADEVVPSGFIPIIPSSADTNYTTLGFEVVNRSEVALGSTPVDLVYGFETYRDEQSGEYTAPFDLADATADTYAVFADATFEISPQLSVIAGVRYDNYERTSDDDSLDSIEEDAISPRVAINYNATDEWQLYGSLSRAFRAPTISEVYADGAHFATGPGSFNNFIPNLDLEPEVADQIELGARFDSDNVFVSGDRLTFGASAYYAEVEDFIFLFVGAEVIPGVFGPPTVNLISQSRNTDAELWGVELEAQYDAGNWFAAAGLQLPSGREDSGDPLGSIPQDKLSLTLGFRPSAAWEIGGSVLFADEKDDIPEGDTADSYVVTDFFGSYIPQGGALEGSTIRVGLFNAFDEDYASFPTQTPMPGRSVRASITYDF